MRNLRSFALGALAIIGLGAAIGAAQTVRNPVRYIPPPTTFYVTATGSDSNKCTATSPCATVTHVLQYILTQYDFQGQDLTINVGAGTFNGDQISIFGPAPGGASATGGSTSVPGWVKIVGAGKASTTLSNTVCSGGTNTIFASDGARVKVGSVTLATSCSAGSTLFAYKQSSIILADADVKFSTAAYARVVASIQSYFGSVYDFEIASGGLYGFSAVDGSMIVFGPATVTLTGTPTYSVAFVDAINQSLYGDGGSTYSGSATGAYFDINNASTVDRQSAPVPMPGSLPGILGQASTYTPNLLACVGGAGGCAIATTPTGLGTGGTATLLTGSGPRMGVIILNTGSGSTADNGTVNIGLPAELQDGLCTATFGIGATTWGDGALVQSAYDLNSHNPQVIVQWKNGGVTLTTGTTYRITYQCSNAD